MKRVKTQHCDNNFYLYVAGIGNWSNAEETIKMCENYNEIKRNIYNQTCVEYENICVYYYDPLIDIHGNLVDNKCAIDTQTIINEIIIKDDIQMKIYSKFIRQYLPSDKSMYPQNHLIIDLADINKEQYQKLNILRIGYLCDTITKHLFLQKLFEINGKKIITINDKIIKMGFTYDVQTFFDWVVKGECNEISKTNLLSIKREFIKIERERILLKNKPMKDYDIRSAVELLARIVWCEVTTKYTINMYITQAAESVFCLIYES